MSSRRARSAPAIRLETGKFEIVANRTAYTSYLTASAAGTAANLANARTRKHPTPPIQPFLPIPPSQFFQRPSEHLAHHRLRQIGAKLDARRHLVRRQALATKGAQLRFRGRVAGSEDDPRFHRFALDCVRDAGHTDLGDRRMRRERFFNLARPHLVAARLDQILLAIDDEEITVGVEIAEIARVQPAARSMLVDVLAQHAGRLFRLV